VQTVPRWRCRGRAGNNITVDGTRWLAFMHAGNSAHVSVSTEGSTAGTGILRHSGTAASRRAALTLGGRRAGGWSGSDGAAAAGRGLTASEAAEKEDAEPEDAAEAAAAEEEADEVL